MNSEGYVVSLPLQVVMASQVKKTFSLNLNVYRNAHFQTLAKAKLVFDRVVLPLVVHIPPMEKVKLVYTFFPRTKARTDVSNICSIVDKFFSDTIVKAGILEDDDYNILSEVVYRFGSIDKLNPRVEVHIIPIA